MVKKIDLNLYVDKYAYRVVWSEDDSGYVGTCLEFPSLSSVEKTHTKALKEIISVVKASAEWMIEDGEPVPEPMSLRKYSGKMNLRITPELHREVTINAAESGQSINNWLAGSSLAAWRWSLLAERWQVPEEPLAISMSSVRVGSRLSKLTVLRVSTSLILRLPD